MVEALITSRPYLVYHNIFMCQEKNLTDSNFQQKTLSRLSLLTHDRKESSAYNEGEQCKSVVFNRAFPSLYKKLDEQES